MTLKDVIRIIRRRILWFIVTVLILLGAYAVFSLTEKDRFSASAKISISAPEEISLLTQSSPRPAFVPASLLSTWMARITNKKIQAECRAILAEQFPGEQNEVAAALAGVKVVQIGQTYDAEIRAAADSPRLAAAVVNTVARIAETSSREDATEHIKKAIADIAGNMGRDRARIAEIDASVKQLQEKMNTIDPERKTARYEDELMATEEQIEKLKTQGRLNESKIGKILHDRVAALHTGKEFIPAATPPIPELPKSRLIERLQDQIFESRYRLNGLRRRYQPNHPEIAALYDNIREMEIDLTNARQRAAADALDLREFDLLNQNDLISIEIKSLLETLRQTRELHAELAALTREYSLLAREREGLRTLVDQMNAINQKLHSFEKASSGFVKVNELSAEKEAFRMEKRSTGMLPMMLLLTVIIAMGVAYMAEFLDTTIKTDYELKRHLNYTLLGTVPQMKDVPVLMNADRCPNIVPEIFDTIGTMTGRISQERPVKTIIVTSANPREGKTTVSINLAIALARQGKSTVLIDGDLRIPAIHTLLSIDNTMGFSELLSGAAMAREMIQKVIGAEGEPGILGEVMRPAGVSGLKVITCGERPATTHEILDTKRLAAIFDVLKTQFDFVVVDTPPLLLTGDALKIATAADAAIFVIEAGKTDQREATWAKHLLASVGANVVGAILNKASTTREQYYRYYYHYGYGRTKR